MKLLKKLNTNILYFLILFSICIKFYFFITYDIFNFHLRRGCSALLYKTRELIGIRSVDNLCNNEQRKCVRCWGTFSFEISARASINNAGGRAFKFIPTSWRCDVSFKHVEMALKWGSIGF